MAKSVLEKIKNYFINNRIKHDGISGMFHYRYYRKMFNKKIMVVLNNGDIVRGIFNAEIPEDESIQEKIRSERCRTFYRKITRSCRILAAP